MVDMVGEYHVDIQDQQENDGRGEAEHGHDQPLLQLHDDCEVVAECGTSVKGLLSCQPHRFTL